MAKAFKICYNHIVREIETDVAMRPPSILLNAKELSWINIKAIWDTGATRSAITNKIVRLLDLKPIGKAVVMGVDIIQKGDFAISNAEGKTTFSFCSPPLTPLIDLSGRNC